MKSNIFIQWSRTHFRSLERYLASKTHREGQNEQLNLHSDENFNLYDIPVWWRDRIIHIGTSVYFCQYRTLLDLSRLSVKINSV